MTPADKLKELREALEGATPGPWRTKRRWLIASTHPPGNPLNPDCCYCAKHGKPEFVTTDRKPHPECGKGAVTHHHLADGVWDDRGHDILMGDRDDRTVAGNYDWEEGGIVERADRDAIVALMNAAPALLAIAEAAAELDAEMASETRYGARVKLRDGLGRLLDHP